MLGLQVSDIIIQSNVDRVTGPSSYLLANEVTLNAEDCI